MTRTEPHIWRNFDPLLLVIALALVSFGALMIYSASYSTEVANLLSFTSPATRHLVYAGLAVCLLIAVAAVDYRLYGQWTIPLYLGGLLLLAVVLAFGQSQYGAKRWLDSPLVPVQPSELVKLTTIIVLARFLAAREKAIKSPKTTALSLVIVGIPAVGVYLQPDLGSAVVVAGCWFGMTLVAGTPLLHYAAMGAAGLAALPFLSKFFLKGYMHDRLATFLDPSNDPLGAGYNILQSEISVGSGGLWGKGFLNGTQTQLHYLRIQKTDFIFSVIGEELGYIGAILLFALFVLLFWRALDAANIAPDSFGRLIVVGITTSLLLQVFINIGVNVRLLPVTGIPLPFISSGGSSLITTFIGLGIMQSVRMRKKRLHRFGPE